jgi:hypothetical protein
VARGKASGKADKAAKASSTKKQQPSFSSSRKVACFINGVRQTDYSLGGHRHRDQGDFVYYDDNDDEEDEDNDDDDYYYYGGGGGGGVSYTSGGYRSSVYRGAEGGDDNESDHGLSEGGEGNDDSVGGASVEAFRLRQQGLACMRRRQKEQEPSVSSSSPAFSSTPATSSTEASAGNNLLALAEAVAAFQSAADSAAREKCPVEVAVSEDESAGVGGSILDRVKQQPLC